MWRYFLSDVERHAQDCRREPFCIETFEVIGMRTLANSFSAASSPDKNIPVGAADYRRRGLAA
jgi:hypothetical protein